MPRWARLAPVEGVRSPSEGRRERDVIGRSPPSVLSPYQSMALSYFSLQSPSARAAISRPDFEVRSSRTPLFRACIQLSSGPTTPAQPTSTDTPRPWANTGAAPSSASGPASVKGSATLAAAFACVELLPLRGTFGWVSAAEPRGRWTVHPSIVVWSRYRSERPVDCGPGSAEEPKRCQNPCTDTIIVPRHRVIVQADRELNNNVN